jgi:hypothetical protein
MKKLSSVGVLFLAALAHAQPAATPPKPAMDLVAGAKRVVVTMEHAARDGSPKIVSQCSLPLTGRHCVDLIVTEMAVIEVTKAGLLLKEIAPDTTLEAVKKATARAAGGAGPQEDGVLMSGAPRSPPRPC